MYRIEMAFGHRDCDGRTVSSEQITRYSFVAPRFTAIQVSITTMMAGSFQSPVPPYGPTQRMSSRSKPRCPMLRARSLPSFTRRACLS
jgi:hypothetical protein